MLSEAFLRFKEGPQFVPPHDFINDRDNAIAQYRRDLQMNTLPGGVLPDGVTAVDLTVGGVKCAHITYPHKKEGWLLVQIHGGGFCAGPPCTQQWPFIKMGMECGIDILSIDYALAPEHPYPAALMDCVMVYKALLDGGQDPNKVIFAGESAGATLCLTTILYAKDHGLPPPAAILAASPCGDAGLSAEERRTYAPDDPLLDEIDQLMQFYIGSADPKTPYLSPVFADFKGMPPIFLICGTNEMLAPDSAAIYKNCLESKVDITVHACAGMGHVHFLHTGLYPEADAALEEMISYVRKVMA